MNIIHYIDTTYDELAALDRNRTVFFSSLSPLETHGPHLPFGTDIYIAEALRDRIIQLFGEKHPDFTAVVLPTIPMGADAIPVAGSMQIRYKAIMYAVLDTGKTLSKLGFKYWLLTDNHGGPSHQIGIELASRQLAAKGFHVITPFHESFRRMVGHDPDLLQKTGLKPGNCGDSADAHAGTNETSLMLAIKPEVLRECWKTLGEAKTGPKKFGSKLLGAIGDALESAGLHDAATDCRFLSEGLAWVGDPNMDPYQGNPSIASKEAGQAMFDYRANLGHELLEAAVAGNRRELKPLGWSLRFLRDVM